MSRGRRNGRNKSTTRRARLVQQALEADPAYEDPSYQWCVNQVKELWPVAFDSVESGPGMFERAKIKLIDLVAERARKVDDG